MEFYRYQNTLQNQMLNCHFFRHTRAERLHDQQMHTIRNDKGSPSGRRKHQMEIRIPKKKCREMELYRIT